MILRSWFSLVWRLAAATCVVAALFAWRIGNAHLAAVVSLGVLLPILFAWIGGRFGPDSDLPASVAQPAVRARPWFGIVLFFAAAVKFALVGYISTQFQPTLHDEWSYLFGAETLARGRLSNPTPPSAEFFDAFHILSTPRWVTRYPPGHPAALALGILAGWPALTIVSLTAGTVVLTYLLGREFVGKDGWLAGVIALMSPGLDFLAGSYLSQSTFLFAITGCYVAGIAAVRRSSPMLAAVSGMAGGYAILTRPYSACAIGLPLAVWFVWSAWSVACRSKAGGTAAGFAEDPPLLSSIARGEASRATQVGAVRSVMLVSSGAVPLVVALVLFAAYNRATTGNSWRTAWDEYNRQFEPDNTLGFSSGSARPIPPEIDSRKAERAAGIAMEKLAFTWPAAIRRAATSPQRLSEMLFTSLGFYGLASFIVFARGTGGSDTPAPSIWLLASAITAHYLAYSFFYSTWGSYSLETIPLFVVLVTLGLWSFWHQGRESDRPGIVLAVPFFLLVALFQNSREVNRLIQSRQIATGYHRDFRSKLEHLTQPALIFVRYDPKRTHEFDLLHNSPDLDGPVVIALDKGERNAELVEQFPGRTVYMYDEATGQMIPWSSEPVVPRARLRVHRRRCVATADRIRRACRHGV